MKNSPHKNRHRKNRAIHQANAKMERGELSEEQPQGSPYHVEKEDALETAKHPKKCSKRTAPSEMHQHPPEHSLVQKKSGNRWQDVKRRQGSQERQRQRRQKDHWKKAS